MKLLAAPTGPDAVRWYRFKAAKFDTEFFEEGVDDHLVKWLGKHGLQWRGFWTNAYEKEAHAVAAIMRQYEVPVIVDVDDYFEGLEDGNVARPMWVHERPGLYRDMLADADRRVCSTPFLAEKYDCQVAPNFIAQEAWDWPQRERNDGKTVLLHCGSINRAEDYLAREKSFRAFLALPDTKIVFMGWMPKWAREYPAGKVVFCRWVEYEKYNRMMRWIAPDILVSPMIHNEFNVAKSNLKWLEAAMCGAAFVGERWGEYARTVNDGTTGVLAEGEAEWTEALMGLALNAETRQHVAEAGRAEVLKSWTWDAVAQQWRKAVLGEA